MFQKYEDQFRNLLGSNEKIIWVQEGETEAVNPILSIIISLIALSILVISLALLEVEHSFMWIIILIFPLIALGIFKESQKKTTTYIATDSRIIFFYKGGEDYKSYNAYSYRKIYKLWGRNNDLVLQTSRLYFSEEEKDYPVIRNIRAFESAVEVIRPAWKKKSPFVAHYEQFQALVNRYGFHMDEHLYQKKNIISIRGNVNGMPLECHIDSLLEINQFKLAMTCPNEWKHHFYLGPENRAARWIKRLGTHDIEVGNEAFDKAYFCRSDDSRFFYNIIDDDVIQSLSQMKYKIPGSFSMGEGFSNSKKKHPSYDTDILDAGVFQKERKQQSRGNVSQMKYQVDDLGGYKTDGAIQHILEIIPTMINIAKNIQSFQP